MKDTANINWKFYLGEMMLFANIRHKQKMINKIV